MASKDYARAVIEFRNAAQAASTDAEPYYQIGLALIETGDFGGAVAAFRKATQLNPSHSNAQIKLAEILSATNHGDLLKDAKAKSPEEEAIKGQLAEEVERAMQPLSDREKEILRLRYGLGTDREYTLEEIGRRLSLTRERVRQIEAGAVAKMRKSKGRAA